MFQSNFIVGYIVYKICHIPSYIFSLMFDKQIENDNEMLCYIIEMIITIENVFEFILKNIFEFILVIPLSLLGSILKFIVDIPNKIYDAICNN